MRLPGWILLPPVIATVAVFAVANRADVLVSFNPLTPASPENSLQIPLYAVVAIAMFIGILLGGATVWMKQRKWRLVAMAEQQRNAELQRLAGPINISGATPSGAA